MIKDDRPLTEKLRQLAKWFNLSNPYAHQLMLDAANEIEYKDRCIVGYGLIDATDKQELRFKLEQAVNRIRELENLIRDYNCNH